jgi:S-adenosylmethionine-dependent methyltransferase
VQDDLCQQHLSDHPQCILDAGGGLGQMSIWLAAQGHSVLLAEPSSEMLVEAHKNIIAAGQTEAIQLQNASIQSLVAESELKQFDGIVLHAVLEWLAEPRETLEQLLSLLKPGGWLSLMFFNQYAREMRYLLGGNFKALREQRIASDGQEGLAPISPLPPETVLSWLPDLKLELVTWSGVRCFYDYAYVDIRKRMPLDELLVLERSYSQREPWRSLARYQHFFCRKLS